MKITTKRRVQCLLFTAIAVVLLAIMLLQPALDIFAEINSDKTQADYGPVYIESDYQSKDDMLAAAMAVSQDISREGVVLLENRNESLPLASGDAVDFIGSSKLITKGGGSSGTINQPNWDYKTDVTSELKKLGVTNKVVSATTNVPEQATEGNAIVLISQLGSENYDSGLTRESSEKQDGGHSLRLTESELKNLRYAANNYTNVIVMLNMGTQFEVGFVTDAAAYFNSQTGVMPMGVEGSYAEEMTEKELNNIINHVNSAILVGFPGDSGATGIAEVIAGVTNPSGRTVDTWYNDFTLDPTFQNFGSNGEAVGTGKKTNDASSGNKSSVDGGAYVHYDEDIYVGYRYYETRCFTDGIEWYEDNMNYPMGFGLSYTNFSYEIVSANPKNTSTLTKDGTITVEVKVTNTGSVAGKEVVQLYYNAPYEAGGIAKAHVILANYTKTGIIQPGESEIVKISYDVESMKSYDWNDANDNGIKGYELEAGNYNVYVSTSAHSWYDIESSADKALKLNYQVDSDWYYDVDSTTGNAVGNIYDDVSTGNTWMNAQDGDDSNNVSIGVQTYFSRDNWASTFPTAGNSATKKSLGAQKRETISSSYYDDETMPWYVPDEEMPTQAEKPGTVESNKIKLLHLSGREYNDPLWDALLNQLTVDEMIGMLSDGFGNTLKIDSIGKPLTYDDDGPVGWTTLSYNFEEYGWSETEYCFSYSSGTLCAQTFNTDLIYMRGAMQGMEGTLGNIHSTNYRQYSGVYAPGANLHRSPFGGRNFEYFSEDPVVSGKTSAQIIDGMQDHGVYCYYKHFFLNEQETNRETLSTWVSEQAMREIYAKGFEIGIKEGKPTGLMSTLAYMGNTLTTESYATHVQLLREEWGFEGMVLTDWKSPVNAQSSVRTGVDLILNDTNTAGNELKWETRDATFVTAVRESTKNVLFAVANSNAMNGLSATPLYSLSNGGKNMTTIELSNFNDSVATMASNQSGTPYHYSVTEGSLPIGLSLNSKTGEITGQATVPGNYSFKVLAEEVDLAVHSREFLFVPYTNVEAVFNISVIELVANEIIFDDATIATDIIAGKQMTTDIASAVYFDNDSKAITEGITYSLVEGETLPTGLTLTADGKLTGTTERATEQHTINVTATYGEVSKTAAITFNIVEQIITYNPVDTSAWNLYVGQLVDISVGGATGVKNIAYTVATETPLPAGLTLNSETGAITGKPIKAYNDYNIIIKVNAPDALEKTATYSLTIKGIITADVTINVQLDRDFLIDLTAGLNDGLDKKMYYKMETAVAGIQMSTNGRLVGNLEKPGTYVIPVIVNCVGYSTVHFNLTIIVYDADTNAQ